MAGGNVVVWEWLNEFQRWTPYSPTVSAYIENQKQNPAAHHAGVNLGNADGNLACYVIDLQNMIQIRQGTGTARNVRRNLYPGTSTAATGINWQWTGDGPNQWICYDVEVSDALEDANNKNRPNLDLSQLPCQLPYTINLRMMNQTRHGSNYVRDVRRIQTATTYPKDTSNSIVTTTGSTSATVIKSSGGIHKKKSSGRHGHGTVAIGTKMTRQTVRNLQIAQQQQQQAQTQPGATTTFGASSASLFPLPPPTGAAAPGPSSFGTFLPATNLPSPFLSASATSTIGSNAAMFGIVNTSMNPAVPVLIPPTSTSTTVTNTSNGTTSASASTPSDSSAEGVLRKYVKVETDPPDGEDCCICCDSLKSSGLSDGSGEHDPVFKLNKCDHMFHKSCLVAMYNSGTKNGGIQCPTCKEIYGEKTGDCPTGTMNVNHINRSLPGYEGHNTIQITYHIPPGIQGPEHPNPGQPYSTRGFPRTGYLPDNKQGRKVLKLLRKAWDRRLMFTVGQSATTGEQGTVVWNEIHHKTEFGSNHSGHGYPDPNYLDNVTMELAIQGVTDSDNETE